MNEQPQLVQIATGKRFFVSKEMIVGRQEGCDLRLAEGKASRRHAKVGPSDDGLWVEDLGSANGTFVNNVRVQTRMQLRSGDRLRFDIEEFDVHLPAAARLPSEAKTALRSEEPQAIRVAGSAAENKPPGAWADPDA